MISRQRQMLIYPAPNSSVSPLLNLSPYSSMLFILLSFSYSFKAYIHIYIYVLYRVHTSTYNIYICFSEVYLIILLTLKINFIFSSNIFLCVLIMNTFLEHYLHVIYEYINAY